MAIQLTFEGNQWWKFQTDDDYDGVPVILPTKKIVCPRCEGEGVHDHSAFSNGITSSEFAELEYDDPDFREDYFNGVYDVRCETCGGANVIDAVDVDRLPDDLKAAYEQWEADEAACAAENAYYRRCAERGIEY